jgi:hypothetical protein
MRGSGMNDRVLAAFGWCQAVCKRSRNDALGHLRGDRVVPWPSIGTSMIANVAGAQGLRMLLHDSHAALCCHTSTKLLCLLTV